MLIYVMKVTANQKTNSSLQILCHISVQGFIQLGSFFALMVVTMIILAGHLLRTVDI